MDYIKDFKDGEHNLLEIQYKYVFNIMLYFAYYGRCLNFNNQDLVKFIKDRLVDYTTNIKIKVDIIFDETLWSSIDDSINQIMKFLIINTQLNIINSFRFDFRKGYNYNESMIYSSIYK